MEEQLFLVLKTEWYEMIQSGEKKEEYRDLSDYWIRRLMPDNKTIRQFKTIKFQLGYQLNAPQMIVECKKIHKGRAKAKWSAGYTGECFVISLGEILKRKTRK